MPPRSMSAPGLALSILPFPPLCTMYRAEAIRIAFPSRNQAICLSYDRDQPLTPSALQFLNYVRKNLVKPPGNVIGYSITIQIHMTRNHSEV